MTHFSSLTTFYPRFSPIDFQTYQSQKIDEEDDEFAAIKTTLLHFDCLGLIIHGIKNSLCSLSNRGTAQLKIDDFRSCNDIFDATTSAIELWLCKEDCRLG